MRRLTVGLLTAAFLCSSAPVVGSGTAAAADTPTAPTTSATTLTARADVDGDGRRDTLQLSRRRVTAEDYTFRLTVATAAGRRAVRDVLVPNYGDGSLQPADVWNGTAAVDGAPGVEVSIDRSGNIGDFPWPHLYTWRSGRLVPAPAPGARSAHTGWNVADHFVLVEGYDVRTVRGRRQIVATHLQGTFDATRERVRFRGTHVTYRWQRGTWVEVARRSSGVLSESAAQRYAGWQGVTWR